MKVKLHIIGVIILIIIMVLIGIFIPNIQQNNIIVNQLVEDNTIENIQMIDNIVTTAADIEVLEPEDEVSIQTITKYTTTYVNLRTGPSTDNEIIKTLSTNTELQVIETEEAWTQVIDYDESGNVYYIASTYLSSEKTEIKVTSRSGSSIKRTEVVTKGTTSSNPLTKSKGVVYFNGHKETWYSQKVLPGGGLNIPGRHVDSRGLVCDGDGYICVASSDYSKGTIVETSLGTGKVYDSGCASGTIDIYTNW